MPEWIQAGASIALIVFLAGGAYVTLSQLRRDLNGIGGKGNEDRKAAYRRYHNLSLAIMLLADKEEQAKLVALLKESD